ncbi:hypothetical protein [Roseisolibacter sp. H3M3-2]|uniref:hypothetical protein n=1 Tax=Roseisolibacter sp. H3M3-2 TaxID=3031323 RepID=UPI0023DCB369|nr:hypothetical protein [Roseisolibacter sp. H3M3-2]MDF1505376.1 hypothetical protein [Roseisolibacter sp. H3M3-2]
MTSLPLHVARSSPDVVVVDERARAATAAAAAPALDAIPPELRDWLVRLRLLDGVPFAYLVADTALLPEESIRWFYMDRRWTDALVQGALSVGTVNSDDRTQLTAEYPAIREALDRAERNRRRRAATTLDGPAGPVSGFILRSRAVSGWPALHVRAFHRDPDEGDEGIYEEGHPDRMRLLRLERLAPAVLLALFDGVPAVVHVEEPRQGVQFGFDQKVVDGEVRPTLRPRSATTFEYLSGAPIDVPFRAGASGVVDIQQLERRLKARPGTGAGDGLDSAEYALQLVRFPYRQVFGDVTRPPVPIVFRPTVSYRTMMELFTVAVQP